LERCDSKGKLVTEIADIFSELNIIHPFREGNGRTQRFFFEELFSILILAVSVNWPDISKDEWVNANIQGYLGDLRSLNRIPRLLNR
jgi:cell filamentation protein